MSLPIYHIQLPNTNPQIQHITQNVSKQGGSFGSAFTQYAPQVLKAPDIRVPQNHGPSMPGSAREHFRRAKKAFIESDMTNKIALKHNLHALTHPQNMKLDTVISRMNNQRTIQQVEVGAREFLAGVNNMDGLPTLSTRVGRCYRSASTRVLKGMQAHNNSISKAVGYIAKTVFK
jgi:hypothetical protein